jgi:Flp pilus assembly pilin Flp
MKNTAIYKKLQRGASMVEYAILVAVIVGAALAALNVFGGKLTESFTNLGNKISDAAK